MYALKLLAEFVGFAAFFAALLAGVFVVYAIISL